MTSFVQYVVDAIGAGAVFALITLGLALLFGIMGLINFAYGELIMVGGYTMIALRSEPWPLLVAGTIAAVAVVALMTERLAFRPLRGADPLTLLLASFAASVILQNGARMTVGATAEGVTPYPMLQGSVAVGGVRIARLDILAVGLAIGLIIGLVVVLRRTRLGLELRAASIDSGMATILGIRSNRVVGAGFVISGVLAGFGALVLIFQQGAVSPTVGSLPVLIAFVAIVIGGMGSLVGAAVGGFALGAVSSVIGAVLPTSLAPFRDAVLFGLVLVTLSLRPQGLIAPPAERII